MLIRTHGADLDSVNNPVVARKLARLSDESAYALYKSACASTGVVHQFRNVSNGSAPFAHYFPNKAYLILPRQCLVENQALALHMHDGLFYLYVVRPLSLLRRRLGGVVAPKALDEWMRRPYEEASS